MAILAVVVAVLVVSYASSLRAYLDQRSQIAGLRSQIATSSAEIATLQAQKSRYADDSYIVEQAREHFGWVLPGDRAYQVIGRDGRPLQSSDRLSDPDQVVRTTPKAWWTEQYESLHQADHPSQKAPPPAGSITAKKG